MTMVLEAIQYQKGSLRILDQLQLPHKIKYDQIESTQDAWHAIRDMRVRGAPAIAIVGMLGVAVDIGKESQSMSNGQSTVSSVTARIIDKLDYIITSRPTAVNLKNAADRLKDIVKIAASKSPQDSAEVRQAFENAAEQMLVVDLQDNHAIGKYGAEWISQHVPRGSSPPVSVLTHCNTGSLATAGYGTALGVVRALHNAGSLRRAYCTETRPYNQGSRLTAFELVHDGIPSMLITDSMAAALLRLRRESENIAAIVVGADRIAANGDTANKIGTFSLAVVARFHGVKFLVAAPSSTVDLLTSSGEAIKIEERAPMEMTSISGPKMRGSEIDLESPAERVSIAASGIDVWNPAFDVTPAGLIDGIITEKGVVEKTSQGIFEIARFLGASK